MTTVLSLVAAGDPPRSDARPAAVEAGGTADIRRGEATRARPRILLSAYACDPERGSEHGVGWNWTRELSRHAEVWVATRANRRRSIEGWEAANGALGVHWIYLEGPRWLLWLKKHGLGIHGYYHCWQRLLFPVARALHQRERFDAVFHLTMNGFREPGYLWRLPCTFVWGPIGGLQDGRAPFLADEPLGTRTCERVRGWINRATARWSPRPRAARARASLLMAANADSLAWARGACVNSTARPRTIVQLLEAGVRVQPPTDDRSAAGILWVGSDERRKNPRFALKAFALLKRFRPAVRLTMIGVSDRRRGELQEWARSRGVDLDGVAFHARVPRVELSAHYARAAIFWFTSWRDTSGNVLLEALSHGAPAMAFDHQGAADILSEGAGVLVTVDRPGRMLARWVDASRRLIDDQQGRAALGERGRALVATRFAWERKPDAVLALLAHPARRAEA